jgi:hypothetical protein
MAQELIRMRSSTKWVRDIAHFVAHLVFRRARGSYHDSVRVFCSCQHGLEVGRLIRESLDALLRRLGRKMRCDYLETQLPTAHPEYLSTRFVAAADAVVGVIPINRSDPTSGAVRELDWVIRETEYANLLGKDVIMCSQDDSEARLAEVRAEVPAVRPLLASTFRRPAQKRRDDYEREVLSQLGVVFHVNRDRTPTGLEGGLRGYVPAIVRKHAVAVVRGVFLCLSAEAQELVREVHERCLATGEGAIRDDTLVSLRGRNREVLKDEIGHIQFMVYGKPRGVPSHGYRILDWDRIQETSGGDIKDSSVSDAKRWRFQGNLFELLKLFESGSELDADRLAMYRVVVSPIARGSR